MILSKEDFFKSVTCEVTEYKDEETGHSVLLKELNAGDALRLMDKLRKGSERPELAAWALVLAAVDDKGERIFTDDDVPALLEARAMTLLSFGGKALEMSGIFPKKSASLGTEDSSSD